ncbi:MAG: aldehyde ferredoxin oxidoreductase family protein [Candidatus Izemoplasma sp.]
MYGLTGKIARVNLSTGVIDDYILDPKIYELYLGGKTLAAKIIFDAFDKKIDAYDEFNQIVITSGILTGSTSPCSSRFNISTISPLTGLLVSSNCGGDFALHLKKAGYDGLIITGKAKEKSYIDINDNKIEILNADHLWGLSTSETQEKMGTKKRGKIVIGQAGENKVRYAAVMSQERAAGRGGIGAVFGDKLLKGVIASGTHKFEFYNKEKFKKHNKKWIKALMKHPITGEQLPKLGTAGLMTMMNEKNLLASKNYKQGSFEGFNKINGETMRSEKLHKNKGCVTCPIQCGRVVTAYGKTVKGPELETLGLLGSNLLNDDLENIINLNYLCDEYGIDTMTFGGTVSLAMELNQNGLWDNGLEFGKNNNLENLVKLVSLRQDIGDDLAEGSKRVSKKYGGEDYAIHVKGMELAAYEPRAAQGMGLGYATSNRGGCHINGGYMVVLEGLGLNISGSTTRGKAGLTIFFQDLMEAVSACGNCIFTTYAILPAFLVTKPNNIISRVVNKSIPFFGGVVGWTHNNTWLLNFNFKSMIPHAYSIKQITGSNMNINKFIKAGERGYNIERLINIRQGLTASEDTLPKRLRKDLQNPNDPNSRVKLEDMIQTYYKIRGWDKQGVPTKKRLKKLKLDV